MVHGKPGLGRRADAKRIHDCVGVHGHIVIAKISPGLFIYITALDIFYISSLEEL